jgi:nucleotide-binding universal stress UspA family protein
MPEHDDDRPAACDTEALSLLARHGIKAEMHREKDIAPGHGGWLLEHAAAKAADLLVMGAYGHSRVGEMILGGVTRTVLHNMNLPVLMSH